MVRDVWEALEVRTGKQKMLWILTIVTATVFYNSFIQTLTSFLQIGTLSAFAWIVAVFVFRIILGYLFFDH